MSFLALLLSALALGLSIILYCTDLAPALIPGRSSVVYAARTDGWCVIVTSIGLTMVSLLLLGRPSRSWTWALWGLIWAWWWVLGKTITVHPDDGRVRSLWYLFGLTEVFAAEEEIWIRADGSSVQDAEEITWATTVTGSYFWITFSYEGRKSSVFVGPLLMSNAMALLAYSGFRVERYQDPKCISLRPTGGCPGKQIPQNLPFLR